MVVTGGARGEADEHRGNFGCLGFTEFFACTELHGFERFQSGSARAGRASRFRVLEVLEGRHDGFFLWRTFDYFHRARQVFAEEATGGGLAKRRYGPCTDAGA